MEWKCDKCGFIAKSQSGLRLHSVKHGDSKSAKPIPEVERLPNQNYFPARIRLFKITGELVLSYSVFGKQEVDKAKENALNRGYRIEIS